MRKRSKDTTWACAVWCLRCWRAQVLQTWMSVLLTGCKNVGRRETVSIASAMHCVRCITLNLGFEASYLRPGNYLQCGANWSHQIELLLWFWTSSTLGLSMPLITSTGTLLQWSFWVSLPSYGQENASRLLRGICSLEKILRWSRCLIQRRAWDMPPKKWLALKIP